VPATPASLQNDWPLTDATTSSFAVADDTTDPLVVIGGGPVGMHFVRRILSHDPTREIVLYDSEPWQPYDRVRLSSLLAGETRLEQIANPLLTTRLARVVSLLNCAVTRIDPDHRQVLDSRGQWQRYDKLILATGSSAAMPDIANLNLAGVFKLRDLGDAERLLARQMRSRHTVVLGGGLLGLEAARAMQRSHTRVTLVHRSPRLLNRQLDDGASKLLQEHVEKLGIQVLLNSSVRAVIGEQNVRQIQLGDGRLLDCDTLIIATGIRPNTGLATEAGIRSGQGFRVDDSMRTSIDRIYAIGECAEHRGLVHGLVAPGLEQANVAAAHILGNPAHYTGSIAATSLKVVGQQTFSIGKLGDEEDRHFNRSVVYEDRGNGKYRKIILRGNRLVGAVAIGEWTELGRLREAVTVQRRVWPWQQWRLRRSGQLWPDSSEASVRSWPASATVCHCRSVNRGALGQSIAQGACSVAALTAQTGAGSVCGSCKPLLEELVSTDTATSATPIRIGKPLLLTSAISLLLALLIWLLPPIPAAVTVQGGFHPGELWTDHLLKQVSGFTVVGLMVVGLAISLRKRTRLSIGQFNTWRVVHVVLGMAAVMLLVAHTGLDSGSNLNRLLMFDMIAIALLGALTGVVMAIEQRLPPRWSRRLRSSWSMAHILLLWPLPALLGFHVLASYYY